VNILRKSAWFLLCAVVLIVIFVFVSNRKPPGISAGVNVAPTSTSVGALPPAPPASTSTIIVAPQSPPELQHISPTSTPYKAPAGWKTYTDSKFKFSFSYPPDFQIEFSPDYGTTEGNWYMEVISPGTIVVMDSGPAPYEKIELTPALSTRYLKTNPNFPPTPEYNDAYFSSKQFSDVSGYTYKGLIKTAGGLGYLIAVPNAVPSPNFSQSLFLIPQTDGAWFIGSDDFSNDGTHKSNFNSLLNTLKVL
jgi:hypothetical protein